MADVRKLPLIVRKLAAGIPVRPYIGPHEQKWFCQVVGSERADKSGRDSSDQTRGLLQAARSDRSAAALSGFRWIVSQTTTTQLRRSQV